MIDRDEFLVDCVTTVASDDYESFEIILEQTQRLAVLNGMNVTEAEVAKAVEPAVTDGLVEAYILSPLEPHSVKARYSGEQLHDFWFYVTARSKRTARSMAELSGEGG